MLQVGQMAPDFTVKTHRDRTVKLSDFRGRRVILWFYPKADTPGCALEGCGFRDLFPQIEAKSGVVLGVSFDTVEENRKFAEKFAFPYELLCDVDRKIGVAYGAAKDASASSPSRIGYVIDESGKIARAYPNVDARTFPEMILSEL